MQGDGYKRAPQRARLHNNNMVSFRITLLLSCLAIVSAATTGNSDLDSRDNGMLLRYKLHGCGSKGDVPDHCWKCQCGPVGNLKCGNECKAAGCGCIPV